MCTNKFHIRNEVFQFSIGLYKKPLTLHAANTETTLRLFLYSWFWNVTTPPTFANKVWSLPIPTLGPAFILLPRCRTIIPPAEMGIECWTLIPRRRPAESRPLLELPPAFLVAFRIWCDKLLGIFRVWCKREFILLIVNDDNNGGGMVWWNGGDLDSHVLMGVVNR